MDDSSPSNLFEKFSEEEKFGANNFTLIIDHDGGFNPHNNYDFMPERPMQMPGRFEQNLPGLQPFPSFTDTYQEMEALQSRNRRIEMHDSWLMGGIDKNESRKSQSSNQSRQMESPEEINGNMKTKKIKINKQVEIKVAAEALSKTKANTKNTYINKIQSLITEERPKSNQRGKETVIQDEFDEEDDLIMLNVGVKNPKLLEGLHSGELEQDTKARIRESAKNTRLRKKAYIDLLEKTVEKLQKELTETRRQLEVYKHKIDFQPKQLDNHLTQWQQMYERLEKMVNTKADDAEIGFFIDSMKFRGQASHKGVTEIVNSMFHQILDFLMPQHVKYIISAASQNKDLWANLADINNQLNDIRTPETPSSATTTKFTEFWNELGFQIDLSEGQKKQIFRYKKKLLMENQKYEEILLSLSQVRKSLLGQVPPICNLADKFGNFLTPTQIAKLLLLAEKEKYRKEFTSEKIWVTLASWKENLGDESDLSDDLLEPDDNGAGEKCVYVD